MAVARYTSDLTLAEDSVQEAFARARTFSNTLRNPAAHPQLRGADHVALALRFVCGESTADIARVLLLPGATLAARLTRAKKRIAATGLV